MRFYQNNTIVKVRDTHEMPSLREATGRVIGFSVDGSGHVINTETNKCTFLELIKNSSNVDMRNHWFLVDFELDNNKKQLEKMRGCLHDGNLGDSKCTRFFIPYENLIFDYNTTLQQKHKSVRIKIKCVL